MAPKKKSTVNGISQLDTEIKRLRSLALSKPEEIQRDVEACNEEVRENINSIRNDMIYSSNRLRTELETGRNIIHNQYLSIHSTLTEIETFINHHEVTHPQPKFTPGMRDTNKDQLKVPKQQHQHKKKVHTQQHQDKKKHVPSQQQKDNIKQEPGININSNKEGIRVSSKFTPVTPLENHSSPTNKLSFTILKRKTDGRENGTPKKKNKKALESDQFAPKARELDEPASPKNVPCQKRGDDCVDEPTPLEKASRQKRESDGLDESETCQKRGVDCVDEPTPLEKASRQKSGRQKRESDGLDDSETCQKRGADCVDEPTPREKASRQKTGRQKGGSDGLDEPETIDSTLSDRTGPPVTTLQMPDKPRRYDPSYPIDLNKWVQFRDWYNDPQASLKNIEGVHFNFTAAEIDVTPYWFEVIYTSKGWLGTQKVDAYLYLLKCRMQNHPSSFNSNATIFSHELSVFLTAPKRRDLKVPGKFDLALVRAIHDLTKDSIIYTPLIYDSHWVALVISIPSWDITVYDCMVGKRKNVRIHRVLVEVASFLPKMLKLSHHLSQDRRTSKSFAVNWLLGDARPPQMDGVGDCGVFTVKFIEHLILKDADLKDVTPENMDLFRDKMCVDIFHKNIHL